MQIERFVQKTLPGQHRTRLQKMFKCGETKYLIKSTSRYCHNIKREHSSNHIKIVIERTKQHVVVYQECFCMCPKKPGMDKPCSEYRCETTFPPLATTMLTV